MIPPGEELFAIITEIAASCYAITARQAMTRDEKTSDDG
jgi:hypothetical protein